jgi:hypothetical protein
MEIPEPHRNIRSPLGLDMRLYFLSPFEIEMGLIKPELYKFGESKIRLHPASLPYLHVSLQVGG